MAIAIIHSLSETYSTLKTILLSTPKDKLSSDAIINHILVEKKSQQSSQLPRPHLSLTLGRENKKHKIKERENKGKELMKSQSWVNMHTARRRVTTRPNIER